MTESRELKLPIIQNIIRVVCVLAVLALVLISIIVYGAPAGKLFVLLLFFTVYVQIPGLLLSDVLDLSNGHRSTNLACGFFLGWALSVFVYFISDPIPSDLLLYIYGPTLSFIYFFRIVKGSRRTLIIGRVKYNKLSICFYVFIVLILFYSLSMVQFRYMSPALTDYTSLNADKGYHLGLINSLSHDYPVESPWAAGVYVHYHIFSELLLSIPVRLFSLNSDAVLISFGPYLTTYVFGISFYSFFREMSSKSERAGAYCLLVIMSNLYITRSSDSSLALRFALENDNATGYGIPAVLISIVVYKKWHDAYKGSGELQWKKVAALSFMLMLLTGIKGPMALVLIGGLWGTVILGIILRRISFKEMVPLVPVTFGFLLVYLTVLSGAGTTKTSGESIIAFGSITNIAFWKDSLIDFLDSVGIGGPIKLLIILIVFAVFFFTVFFLPFCIGYIRELVLVLPGRKDYLSDRVVVYAACAAGYILMFFTSYSGHSQVYFGLVTVFLSPIVAFWFLEDMEDMQSSSVIAKHALNFTVTVMALAVIATTIGLSSFFARRIDSAIDTAHSNGNHLKKSYLAVSKDEYDAMIWLYENTDKDDLLATDRYYSVAPDKYSYQNRWDNRFFLYAVYSNRFTYISGSGYTIPGSDWELRKEMIETNNKLYDESFDDRGDLARQLDIDYVVVSKRFTEVPDLSNKDYELCYTNNDVDIYRIKNSA